MHIKLLHILYFEKYEKREKVVSYMSLVHVLEKSQVTTLGIS